MYRRWIAGAWIGVAVFATATRSFGQVVSTKPPARDPVSMELRYLEGLRERGYYDLALDYIDGALKNPATPAELKPILDYEVGRGLLEQATDMPDLDRRQALLEQARQKLDAFTKKYPDHRLTSEALMQFARLNLERGHTSLLMANEVKAENDQGQPIAAGRAEREAKLAAARAAFEESRKAYDLARVRLKADYEKYPQFIPKTDPRFAEKERARTGYLEGELQRGVVDYEEAQSYPPGSNERAKLLDAATPHFEQLFKSYRTMNAGLYARMLQGKCLEEKGELGPALGIYKELLEHEDPALRDLQRKVKFFQIIAEGKRGNHALAADEAVNWLALYAKDRNTEEGLGVQLELARDLIAQLPAKPQAANTGDARKNAPPNPENDVSDAERDAALRKAADHLSEVAKYYSPYKPEALKLLQQYQPKAARRANQLTSLNYEDAMSQANNAISTHDWPMAEKLLHQAIRRAQRSREMEKVNAARFQLAYVYYASDRFYEAAVLADHLARRYSEEGQAPKAAEIGLASLTQAYNAYTAVDRMSDLDRLVNLASYVVEKWPNTDQGDNARLTLGEVTMGRGNYSEAAKWLEAVRESSPNQLDARVKAGDAHWRLSQKLREEGKTAEADAEAKAAFELVSKALAARDQANTPPTDPARIANANALAEIHRASGRPAEAITLLDPIAQALQGQQPSAEILPLYASSLSILLRANLAAGQPDRAIALMKVLEGISPSRSALTQLYFELGRTLKNELDALERQNKPAAYKKTQDAYKQFLLALANSQAGQSYESLEWAGESLLDLKMPADAAGVFNRVLDTVGKDPNFTKQPEATGRLMRTRLKLVAALRDSGKFDEARTLVEKLLEENPRLLEPRMEKGLLIEAEARAAGGADSQRLWQQSLEYWQKLALQLRQAPQRKMDMFEAWYHVALAFEGLGKKSEALGTLKSVLTLTPSAGSPEMKARYQALVNRLSGGNKG